MRVVLESLPPLLVVVMVLLVVVLYPPVKGVAGIP